MNYYACEKGTKVYTPLALDVTEVYNDFQLTTLIAEKR